MPATDNAASEYAMTLPWYEEVKSVVYSDRPEFNEPHEWRRECVEDIYHQFRDMGESHQQALSDTIVALPQLFQDASGQVHYHR